VLSTPSRELGFTGPILRSTGAARDLRKDTPYLAYAELDFEFRSASRRQLRPLLRAHAGDRRVGAHDRQLVTCCGGPLCVETGAAPSRKGTRLHEIESLINHFKL